MKTYYFTQQIKIHKTIQEVFEFFSNAENLNRITPPHLEFKILTPQPIQIEPGTTIDYRLRLYKFPIHWKTKITAWEPPYRFVDAQLKGPYKKWIHQHRFQSENDGTIVEDNLEYAIPGGIAAPFIHWIFVKRDIENIFRFRAGKLDEIFS